MKVKLLFLKFRLKYFPRFAKKDDFNQILAGAGIKVGKGTIFYDPNSMAIDRERPWMLEIGDYCKITRGTTILTHDYSRSVIRRAYGDVVGEAGKTIIGNNVFIGMHSIILMGTHIGDNVIIGAGSVVRGNIPDNCVAAGNPCRVLCTLDDFYKKRKEKTLHEAVIYYKSFCKAKNRKPTVSEMGPFFWLFLQRTTEQIDINRVNVSLNGDEKEEIIESFLKSTGEFSSYEDFTIYADEITVEE